MSTACWQTRSFTAPVCPKAASSCFQASSVLPAYQLTAVFIRVWLAVELAWIRQFLRTPSCADYRLLFILVRAVAGFRLIMGVRRFPAESAPWFRLLNWWAYQSGDVTQRRKAIIRSECLSGSHSAGSPALFILFASCQCQADSNMGNYGSNIHGWISALMYLPPCKNGRSGKWHYIRVRVSQA